MKLVSNMLPVMHLVTDQLKRRNNIVLSSLLRQLSPTVTFKQSVRRNQKNSSVTSLFPPAPVESTKHTLNVGAELTGQLKKPDILRILYTFFNTKSIKELSGKYGLDDVIFEEAMKSFRTYCVESASLPADLHIILSDLIQNVGNVTDLFPYFLSHVKQMYPHIVYLDDLKKISDLTNPPSWYPLARLKNRKLVFHAGPTNSGKTYQALKRFISAKSGVYCGPLKLLAVEVFNKCNGMGVPCDLVTGEDQKYIKSEDSPSPHVSCSVEMVNLNSTYEVAVIDEIQMLRDPNRGWAWTRAFLGVVADEVHLCGENAAIPIVQSICKTMGERLEVKEYKRLAGLEIEKKPLGSLSNIQEGDCIVCFNKNDVYTLSNTIEKMGKEVAVIYGSLPPGTKLAQAARFNDPNDSCKIMVATNAIGMGLNLHIRRIIFFSLCQVSLNEKGEMVNSMISVSSALQIAGRAGRYGTKWPKGYVTTYKAEDLKLLSNLLSQSPEQITRAGLHPTAEQIELYAYYLPNAPLSNLINIFIALCELDSTLYFICTLNDFKFFADMIQHIPLPLRIRYLFCCSPVNKKVPFTCSMLLKYARRCSKNQPADIVWLCKEIDWPPQLPKNIFDLIRLESVFDVLDHYLWLSYRMPDLFPNSSEVRILQQKLDQIIEQGISAISKLKLKDKPGTSQEKNGKMQSLVYSKTTLSGSLISKGLLTPGMLEVLKKEWEKECIAKLTKKKI